MQQQIRITLHGVEPSDFIEQRVRESAAELERFSDQITSCHVTVEAPHRRHQQGNLYSVHLDIHLPGEQFVVGTQRHQRHAHEDVYVAIRDAFGAALRQLEDYTRKRRDQERRPEADKSPQ